MKDWKMFKEIYKDAPSIFVKNIEEVLDDETRRNRFDEYVLKCIGVGYMMMSLELHSEIKAKLTEEDIDNLIYSIGCNMADFPEREALLESTKYNLDI